MDADLIQYYTPSHGLTETSVGSVISFFEASTESTKFEDFRNLALEMDLVIFAVDLSVRAHSNPADRS